MPERSLSVRIEWFVAVGLICCVAACCRLAGTRGETARGTSSPKLCGRLGHALETRRAHPPQLPQKTKRALFSNHPARVLTATEATRRAAYAAHPAHASHKAARAVRRASRQTSGGFASPCLTSSTCRWAVFDHVSGWSTVAELFVRRCSPLRGLPGSRGLCSRGLPAPRAPAPAPAPRPVGLRRARGGRRRSYLRRRRPVMRVEELALWVAHDASASAVVVRLG